MKVLEKVIDNGYVSVICDSEQIEHLKTFRIPKEDNKFKCATTFSEEVQNAVYEEYEYYLREHTNKYGTTVTREQLMENTYLAGNGVGAVKFMCEHNGNKFVIIFDTEGYCIGSEQPNKEDKSTYSIEDISTIGSFDMTLSQSIDLIKTVAPEAGEEFDKRMCSLVKEAHDKIKNSDLDNTNIFRYFYGLQADVSDFIEEHCDGISITDIAEFGVQFVAVMSADGLCMDFILTDDLSKYIAQKALVLDITFMGTEGYKVPFGIGSDYFEEISDAIEDYDMGEEGIRKMMEEQLESIAGESRYKKLFG